MGGRAKVGVTLDVVKTSDSDNMFNMCYIML